MSPLLPSLPISRRALIMLAVAAGVTLAIGAGDALDEARTRLQNMSAQQRAELTELLNQFELQSTPEQQKAMRDIDRQISTLGPDERARYLVVLRRYHNWLDSLPESARNNLQAKPPGERFARIKTLVATYPVARAATPAWMQFADVAGATPLELAATFKVWQELKPDQRREIETQTNPGQRRAKLWEYVRELKLQRELRPADFAIEDWVPKVEAKLAEIQSFDPEIRTALTKAGAVFKQKSEAKQKAAHGITPLMRRLAINLYFLEQPPPRPVDTQHLTQFFAAMPPWVRTHFDSYPADEARRKLTLVYRLLFPNNEFRPIHSPAAAGSTTAAQAAPTHRPNPAPTPAPAVPATPKKDASAPKPPQPATPSPF